MSADAASEFQKLVLDTLLADASVSAIVGSRIYDGAPAGSEFPYISFGPADETADDAECITSSIHTLQLDAWARDGGRKRPCKVLVGAIKSALHFRDLALPDPFALVQVQVPRASVVADPDGLTAHGIISVEAMIETHG